MLCHSVCPCFNLSLTTYWWKTSRHVEHWQHLLWYTIVKLQKTKNSKKEESWKQPEWGRHRTFKGAVVRLTVNKNTLQLIKNKKLTVNKTAYSWSTAMLKEKKTTYNQEFYTQWNIFQNWRHNKCTFRPQVPPTITWEYSSEENPHWMKYSLAKGKWSPPNQKRKENHKTKEKQGKRHTCG